MRDTGLMRGQDTPKSTSNTALMYNVHWLVKEHMKRYFSLSSYNLMRCLYLGLNLGFNLGLNSTIIKHYSDMQGARYGNGCIAGRRCRD